MCESTDRTGLTLGAATANGFSDRITGTYLDTGCIVFSGKPNHPWEFMATGTGVTGLTVSVDRGIRIQLNHPGALDDSGMLRALGILQLDFVRTTPFTHFDRFHMQHNLRTSEILIEAQKDRRIVRCLIRAHHELDVISVEILDSEPEEDEFIFSVSKDYAHGDEICSDGTYLSYHTNGKRVLADGESWSAGTDYLLGRCFGAAMKIDCEQCLPNGRLQTWLSPCELSPMWTSGSFSANFVERCVVWIAGGATRGGEGAWRADVLSRIGKAHALGIDGFTVSHRGWWADFWVKARFAPGNRARFIHQIAAFDLYRYYMACCADERREFPVRFQIDAFRYSLSQHMWSVMDITSLETYQALYGAVRTGAATAVHSRIRFYLKHLSLFRKLCRERFAHEGTICAYETGVDGNWLMWRGQETRYNEVDSPYLRYSWAGNIWMLYLMCDLAALDAEAANDADLERGFREFATGVLEFFKSHYPKHAPNGSQLFAPSAAGETWIGVVNSAELIAALRATIPRLVALAESRRWDPALIDEWLVMYECIPELPKGRLTIDPATGEGRVEPGDLLVPAHSLDRSEPRVPINRQHVELFSVWPAKLSFSSDAEIDRARRTYFHRHWQHITQGWDLDTVFAACLGLQKELDEFYPIHFERTHVFPCGLAQEGSPKMPDAPCIPLHPSAQGLGTSVIPVIEQLIQDFPDRIRILPCWPPEEAVDFRLFSPFAGWIEVTYEPGKPISVSCESPTQIDLPEWALNGQANSRETRGCG